MAYPNNKNYGGRSWDQPPRPKQTAKEFPADYVDFADEVVANYLRTVKYFNQISTSKLRNILGMLMDVYNIEKLRVDPLICEESVVKLQVARIRLAYECGRDSNVTKRFVDDTYLMTWLKDAGNSREKVLNYIHYVEALVAYHRYHGGKD